MLIPSEFTVRPTPQASLSRRVNANSQQSRDDHARRFKLIKKGEC